MSRQALTVIRPDNTVVAGHLYYHRGSPAIFRDGEGRQVALPAGSRLIPLDPAAPAGPPPDHATAAARRLGRRLRSDLPGPADAWDDEEGDDEPSYADRLHLGFAMLSDSDRSDRVGRDY